MLWVSKSFTHLSRKSVQKREISHSFAFHTSPTFVKGSITQPFLLSEKNGRELPSGKCYAL